MKRRGIDMRVRAAILTAMLVLVAPAAVIAQIKIITVRVDGLSCPFCAYGLSLMNPTEPQLGTSWTASLGARILIF